MINDFDKRQLSIMLDKIEAFLSNKLEIKNLLNDLEALLNVLEDIDDDWKESFYSEWLNIEEMYAYALSEKRKKMLEDEQIIINESLIEIKKLIFSKIT